MIDDDCCRLYLTPTLPTTPGHRADCPCIYCTQEAGFRCAVCKCPTNRDGYCMSCYEQPRASGALQRCFECSVVYPGDRGDLCPYCESGHAPIVDPGATSGTDFNVITKETLNTKPTNPKDAIGSAKVPGFSVVPRRVVSELGLALLEGSAKYGRHNYRSAGVRASVYVDALDRHLSAWWEGQDLDPDSGLSHVTKAIACLAVLRDSMQQGSWQDDRPPRVSDSETWVSEANAKAAALLAKFPDPKPPCTEK